VACVRARLAPLGGERGHSKSGLHPWYPLKGVPIFIFLPHNFLAVTVTRHAEKHFALLFSAGNSYTVYIRPSKIPGNSRIFFAALFGSRHRPPSTYFCYRPDGPKMLIFQALPIPIFYFCDGLYGPRKEENKRSFIKNGPNKHPIGAIKDENFLELRF